MSDAFDDFKYGLIVTVHKNGTASFVLRGETLRLKGREAQLLLILALNGGPPLSRDDIYDRMYGNVVVDDGQVHFQMHKLRRAIDAAVPGASEIIRVDRSGAGKGSPGAFDIDRRICWVGAEYEDPENNAVLLANKRA